MRLAIIGATGAQGHAIAQAAMARGAGVQVLARPHAIRRFSGRPCRVVCGDLSWPDTIVEVMRDCDAAIYTPPLTFDEDQAVTWLSIVMSSAEQARVRRLVMNSAIRPPAQRTGVTILDVRRALEIRIRAAAMETVLVRATLYLGTLLVPAIAAGLTGAQRQLAYPLRPDLACQWTTWEDVAAVAVAAAAAPGRMARVLDVGGREVVRGQQLADRIGATIGARLSYVQPTSACLRRALHAMLGPLAAREIPRLYDWLNAGGHDALIARRMIDETLGVRPTGIAEWSAQQDWHCHD